MAHPFGKMPTLAEFVKEAEKQGCVVRKLKGNLYGPHGEEQCTYLTRPSTNIPVVLPNISDEERLTPIMLGNLVRVLRVVGYEHLVTDGP